MKHTLLTLTIASLLVTTAFADPIHDAARDGDLAGVQAELDNDVDVEVEDDIGWTPLHYAAWRGHKEVAELLIENGAEVSAKSNGGWTPLHNAASHDHKETAELLIVAGADVNAQIEADTDYKGNTPLDNAIRNKNTEIADLIRANRGITGAVLALHDATKAGDLVAVQAQLDAGVDVDAKEGIWGHTPLHGAAWKGRTEVAELLIAKGADVNAKANNGRTSLHFAAFGGQKKIVELLIAKGADVNAKDYGVTPLDEAIEYDHPETAALLYKHGGKTAEELKLFDRLAAIEATLDKLQGLILGDGDAVDQPSIEKLQGVFVIRGKVGGKYEVEYHTGNNVWQVREEITLTANRQLYIDSSSYDEKRFYRVKLAE